MSEHENQDIAITALGGITAVGGNAEQSVAAIRAGRMSIAEHEIYKCEPDDPEWHERLPCYVSAVPVVGHYIEKAERFYQLVMPALEELMSQARLKRKDLEKCGLFLSLPPMDATIANIGLDERFLGELAQRTGLLNLKTGKINRSGSSGMFEHVGDAMALLQSGELDFCIVGGVDSWLLKKRLGQLDLEMRLKSGRNRDGFIPGEAATMIMLERTETARSRNAAIMSVINGFGRGKEPKSFYSQKNSSGQGLTAAIDGVLSTLDSGKVFNTVYCDLNGESYYATENGLVLSRRGRSLADVDLIHPVTHCGDVGAAMGGLLIACATMAHYRALGPGDDVLLWTASDNGARAALSLQQCDIEKLC